jgi:hypothetical protein
MLNFAVGAKYFSDMALGDILCEFFNNDLQRDETGQQSGQVKKTVNIKYFPGLSFLPGRSEIKTTTLKEKRKNKKNVYTT